MTDLHNAISMHPSPFLCRPEQAHPDRPESSNSKTSAFKPSPRATSTSIEPSSRSHEYDPTPRRPTTSLNENDIENQPPDYDDPFSLSRGLKTPSELGEIRANTSRKRDGFGPVTLNHGAHKAKKLQDFYEVSSTSTTCTLFLATHNL